MCSARSQTVYHRVWRRPSKNLMADKNAPKPAIKLRIKAMKIPAGQREMALSLPRRIILFSAIRVKGEVVGSRLTTFEIWLIFAFVK